jgi:hypothetical protein
MAWEKTLRADITDAPKDSAACDVGTPPPLPILLRVPWFPSEAPATASVPAERSESAPAERQYCPLVIRPVAFPAKKLDPRGWRRRPGVILVALMLVAFIMGVYRHWKADSETAAATATSFSPADPDRASAPRRSKPRPVELSPEIVPLDTGGEP